MASTLALLNFISYPLMKTVAFHSHSLSSARRQLLPDLLPSARRSKHAKCHQSDFIQGEFNLAGFLQGDWILHKNISYSKLYQDLSGNEGDASFEGQASFVSVKPPLTASDPHHFWYKEHGLVTMDGRSTVRCLLSPSELP